MRKENDIRNDIRLGHFGFEEFSTPIFILNCFFAEESVPPIFLLSRSRTRTNVFIQKHGRVLTDCHQAAYEQDKLFHQHNVPGEIYFFPARGGIFIRE